MCTHNLDLPFPCESCVDTERNMIREALKLYADLPEVAPEPLDVVTEIDLDV